MVWRALIITSLLMGCVPKDKKANCLYNKSAWGSNISWKGNIPIVLTLHSSYPPEYIEQLEEAILIWESAVNRNLFILNKEPDRGMRSHPNQDRKSLVYWPTSWDEFDSNTNALTRMYVVGNTIVEADIALNGQDHAFFTEYYSTGSIHLTSVLVHELGHVLGLSHNDHMNSVMYKGLRPAEIKNILSEEDVNNLKCEYN